MKGYKSTRIISYQSIYLRIERRGTHVIINILPRNMQHRSTKITIPHLQRIIQSPHRRSKTITQPREPTTTRRICLEHQELLSGSLGDIRAVEIGLDDVLRGGMIEVGWEDGLGGRRLSRYRIRRNNCQRGSVRRQAHRGSWCRRG